MSRFTLIPPIAVILLTWALATHHYIMGGVVIFIFMVITGLGVAIPQLRLFGNFICFGDRSRKRVALTFDDGPDPRSTPQLLELLREQKIPAAFFCIGRRVDENPGLAARIVREGHLVGNHSYAHSNFTNFYPRARLRTELIRGQQAIEKACGFKPRYYRPPIGNSNPNTFRAARDLNLQVIGWSIRSLDTVIAQPEKILARIRRGLAPGAIILLHDGNIPNGKLVQTVKSLLDTLRELGYEVVRLDELLK
jgi:peptidoglycan/xylan/chitin deacetylase (PgdA/CDA1 family)